MPPLPRTNRLRFSVGNGTFGRGLLAQLVEQLTFNQLVAGSNPAQPTISSPKRSLRPDASKTSEYGLLAQLVEQLTFNQLVAGSNPAQPTISCSFHSRFFAPSVRLFVAFGHGFLRLRRGFLSVRFAHRWLLNLQPLRSNKKPTTSEASRQTAVPQAQKAAPKV